LPQSQLLLSLEPEGDAEDMRRLAGLLGIDTRHVSVFPIARDTRTEAEFFHKQLGAEPFVLITSAAHMPRAMAIFRSQGMNPVPAPTDFRLRWEPAYDHWLPTTGALGKTESAFHEYLGSAWHWLTQ
jgi:uncharacterized SAM-binding protein YcdF (DUF218 family)